MQIAVREKLREFSERLRELTDDLRVALETDKPESVLIEIAEHHDAVLCEALGFMRKNGLSKECEGFQYALRRSH